MKHGKVGLDVPGEIPGLLWLDLKTQGMSHKADIVDLEFKLSVAQLGMDGKHVAEDLAGKFRQILCSQVGRGRHSRRLGNVLVKEAIGQLVVLLTLPLLNT